MPGTCNASDAGFCTISSQKRNGNYPSEKTKELPIAAVMMQRLKPVFRTVWISAGWLETFPLRHYLLRCMLMCQITLSISHSASNPLQANLHLSCFIFRPRYLASCLILASSVLSFSLSLRLTLSLSHLSHQHSDRIHQPQWVPLHTDNNGHVGSCLRHETIVGFFIQGDLHQTRNKVKCAAKMHTIEPSAVKK